ncbi:MAG: acyl carrier protein [Thermoanaerobaculia bacterium]
MANLEKLEALLIDVFLLDPSEFRFDLTREDVDTWDSLGVVAVAVGIKDTFGYHLSIDEASSIRSVADIITILESKGIRFDG